MKKLITLIFATAFLFQSCGNDRLKRAKESVQQTTKVAEKDSIEEFHEEFDYAEADNLYAYPKTGNKAEDFLPKIGIYEIQYEGKGDLNNDGLSDLAVVLRVKDNKTQARPTLILLQIQNKTYRLDKVSNFVMPIEYNEYDYKLFDTEEISIENGELNIKLYGKDNSFGTFKYFGNDLLLSSVEAFYRGAGSQEGIKYDFLKGEQTTTEIDLISDVENPKVTENKNSIDKEKHYFENISIIDFFNN